MNEVDGRNDVKTAPMGFWKGLAMLVATLTLVGASTFAGGGDTYTLITGRTTGGGGVSEGGGLFVAGSTVDGSTETAEGGDFSLSSGSGLVPPPPPPEPADPCPSDIDESGDVGFADLLTVLSSWGSCTGACPADLDASGDVGFADLLTVLSSWGVCP